MQSKRPQFGVLLPEFQGEYFRSMGLGRVGFADWCRHERQPHMSFNERYWPKMMSGEIVPWDLLDALSEYVSERLDLGQYPLSRIAKPSPPPSSVQPGRNLWNDGFVGALDRVSELFSVHELSFCRNPQDIQAAARLVVTDVGRCHSAKELTEAEAIQLGVEVMCRTLDEYVAQLESWWQCNPRTVMFAVRREKGKPYRRVGVTVIVPITEDFYVRMARGEASDMDLTPTDIVYPSARFHVNAVAEERDVSKKRLLAFGRAVIHTGSYQIAMLSPELEKNTAYPAIVTFAGTKVTEQRVANTGYSNAGHEMPRVGKPVFTLSADNGILGNKQYGAFYVIIRLYQTGLKSERQLVDATD